MPDSIKKQSYGNGRESEDNRDDSAIPSIAAQQVQNQSYPKDSSRSLHNL